MPDARRARVDGQPVRTVVNRCMGQEHKRLPHSGQLHKPHGARMRISLCQNCGKRFTPRAGKRYCSDRCRWEAHQNAREPCYYCGAPAQGVDHIPPRVARAELIALGIDKWDFLEVPACSECNSALGGRPIWILTARKEFIKKWLRRRYAKYLAIPAWTDEQRKDLGSNLSQFIDEGLLMAQITHQRIRW
jgi:hypothetical protein